MFAKTYLLITAIPQTNAFYISKIGLDQKANAVAAEEIRTGAEAVRD